MTYLWMMTTNIHQENIMHYFYRQISMNMYLQEHKMIEQNEELVIKK